MSAADLLARVYAKAPVMVDPVYSWTGFCVGINGGYSWGRASETAPIGAPFPGSFTARQDVNGGFGGGQIGYNWQVDPRWLLGLEADIQGSGERGRSNDALGSIRIGVLVLRRALRTASISPGLRRSEAARAFSLTQACCCT